MKIHHNLRILDNVTDFDYEETCILWDVDVISDDEGEQEVGASNGD